MLDLLGTIQNTNKENSNTYQPSDESQRLLPSNASGDSAVGGSSQQHQYYFLGKAGSDYQGGTSASVRDADGGEVVEEIPEGSHTDEFAPKQLVPLVRIRFLPLLLLTIFFIFRLFPADQKQTHKNLSLITF